MNPGKRPSLPRIYYGSVVVSVVLIGMSKVPVLAALRVFFPRSIPMSKYGEKWQMTTAPQTQSNRGKLPQAKKRIFNTVVKTGKKTITSPSCRPSPKEQCSHWYCDRTDIQTKDTRLSMHNKKACLPITVVVVLCLCGGTVRAAKPKAWI